MVAKQAYNPACRFVRSNGRPCGGVQIHDHDGKDYQTVVDPTAPKQVPMYYGENVEVPAEFVVTLHKTDDCPFDAIEVLMVKAEMTGMEKAEPWKVYLRPNEDATIKYNDGHAVRFKFIGDKPLPTDEERSS